MLHFLPRTCLRTLAVLNHITLDLTLSISWYGLVRVRSSTVRGKGCTVNNKQVQLYYFLLSI